MKERVQRSVGRDVEVEVDAAIVVEDEIAKGVGTLDRMRVGIE
jgi:hypothetical protein